MEFVDGPSLADLLADGPADPVFALDVVAQAADGLSAAHRAGLVHRDVKPGNILIGAEGQVKVTDFGIAHAVGQTPVTDPALVMGTSQYLAPERIAGGPGTPASDLYSLGIVLHECLTAMPPYDGSPAEVMASHLYLPLPPLPAGVPPELDTLVTRLTAKDPARRLHDARELAGLASRLRDTIAAGPALVPGAAGPGPARPALMPGPAGPGPAGPGGWNRGEPVVWDLDTPVAAQEQAAVTMTSTAGPHGHAALAGERTAPPYPPDPLYRRSAPGSALPVGSGRRPAPRRRRRPAGRRRGRRGAAPPAARGGDPGRRRHPAGGRRADRPARLRRGRRARDETAARQSRGRGRLADPAHQARRPRLHERVRARRRRERPVRHDVRDAERSRQARQGR